MKPRKVIVYFFYLFFLFDFISCHVSFLKRKYTKGYHIAQAKETKALENLSIIKNNKKLASDCNNINYSSLKESDKHPINNPGMAISDYFPEKLYIHSFNRKEPDKNILLQKSHSFLLKELKKFHQDTLMKNKKLSFVKIDEKSINRTIKSILICILLIFLLYTIFYYVEPAYLSLRSSSGCLPFLIILIFTPLTILFLTRSVIRLIKFRNYEEQDREVIKKKLIWQLVLSLLMALILFLILNATWFVLPIFGELGFM